MERTLPLFPDAVVVAGLMTLDIDRAVLSLRDAPKPRLRLEGGALVRGQASAPEEEGALAHGIRSFLYRKLLFSRFIPSRVRASLRDEAGIVRRKKELAGAILDAMAAAAGDRELLFLVFHPHVPGVAPLDGEGGWRDEFLRGWLENSSRQYIWSRDLFREHAADPPDVSRWIRPEDGHPTGRFNWLVSAELRRRLTGEGGEGP